MGRVDNLYKYLKARLMEVGVVGQPGAAAPRPADQELRAGAESVKTPPLLTEERSVGANRRRGKTAVAVSEIN